MSDTPRTSEEWRRIQRRPDGRYGSEITYQDLAHGMSNFAKQLERELAAVTEQRDRLAEALWSMLNKDDMSAIRAGILLRSLGLQSPTNPNEL
jgi:hypothetical protein